MPTSNTAPTSGPVFSLRGLVVVLTICAGAVALVFLIAAALSQILDQPYQETSRVLTILISVPILFASFGTRLYGLIRRGRLLCDCDPNPKQRFYRWLAIVSLLIAIGNLEVARRIAELAPVEARLRQDLNKEMQVLLRIKQHLTDQKELLSGGGESFTEIDRLMERLRQDQAEQSRLNELVQQDRADRTRLAERLVPDRVALRNAMRQLGTGIILLGTQPWEVLRSTSSFQLFLSIIVLSSAISLFSLSGRNQVRANGMWQNSSLVPWKSIRSYRWADDSTLVLIWKKGRVSSPVRIPADDKQTVAELLTRHFGPPPVDVPA